MIVIGAGLLAFGVRKRVPVTMTSCNDVVGASWTAAAPAGGADSAVVCAAVGLA
jgi:hypothetical protein